MLLQPLQGRDEPATPVSRKRAADEAGGLDIEEVKRLRMTVENQAGRIRNMEKQKAEKAGKPPKGLGKAGGKPGGKGGGKGAGKPRAPVRMPQKLIGMNPSTEAGEPICFNFNLDGCQGAEDGQKCEKGWHVKMKPLA